MQIDTNPEKIETLLTRGVEEVIHYDELKSKLLSGKQLRVKLGIDPTSAHVHIGRSVPLLKLRDFQELGHQIILIIGDFTGIIGDTSDKESERPMLTREAVDENKKTYLKQVEKILDINKVEFRYNSEWLEKLTYRELGEHADLFSVADFIARDNIKRRLDTGKRVSLRETLYPLMQGYDSVAIQADVELGGTDQRFNLLAGRTMQPHFGQDAQNILMSPLIHGTDGRKMSSSWGNTINLLTPSNDMFGKVMSMRDEDVVAYFEMCTRLPMHEIQTIEVELAAGANPRDMKLRLAYEITRMYHGDEGAKEGQTYFSETFQQKQVPEDVLEIKKDFVEELIAQAVVSSKAELRRLLEAGGVRNAETGEKITEIPETVSKPTVLKLGKRRFVKLLP
ncbi:tyrosine--tRNA ligase [Candidatus Kaiserbacteria bacterium]|nr:MAG: tyrosine--tRNA ligase [Candidatus Kaiserbacteria bacterium]